MNAPPIETQEARTGRLPPRPGVGALTDPRSWARLLLTNEFGLAALIAIFGAVFALGTPGFGSSFNLFTLGRTMAIDIMIGFSMMVVIVTGGLNLSVGAIGVCSAAMFGWLLERAGFPVPLAVGAALALGGALGAVNGVLIVRSGLHSFIITLATMSIFFGMMIFLTRAEAFRNLPAEVSAFGKMRFFGYLSPAAARQPAGRDPADRPLPADPTRARNACGRSQACRGRTLGRARRQNLHPLPRALGRAGGRSPR